MKPSALPLPGDEGPDSEIALPSRSPFWIVDRLSQAGSDLSPGTILQSISDVVEVVDRRGVIVYSNLPLYHKRRLGLERVMGRRCHQVYDKVCTSCRSCPLEKVFRTGKPLTQDRPIRCQGGLRCWARQHLYPIRDRMQRISGALRLVFDITREKDDLAEHERHLASLGPSLGHRRPEEAGPPASDLSPREHQVLLLVADGLSNQEIARLLGLSPNTVKTHLVHIFNKLGVNRRTQAAMTAARLNLL